MADNCKIVKMLGRALREHLAPDLELPPQMQALLLQLALREAECPAPGNIGNRRIA